MASSYTVVSKTSVSCPHLSVTFSVATAIRLLHVSSFCLYNLIEDSSYSRILNALVTFAALSADPNFRIQM